MGRDTHYDRFKKQKSSSLKKARHRFEYVALKSVRAIASLFPVRWNQRFGALFGRIALILASKDRGIAEYQLGFCFPELDESSRHKLLKNTFRNMGITLFETLVITKIKQTPSRWIKFENEKIIYDLLKEGQGLVLMFGHVGNWELYAAIYEMLDIKGITISGTIGDGKLDELLIATRSSSNIKVVHRGDRRSAKEILRCFRNNEVFLFAMDQDTRVKTVYVDFFGRKAATAIGAALFAQRFNAPVVSGFGARLEDGTHLYRFEVLSKKPYAGTEAEVQQLTTDYNKALEKHIRCYPDQWVWFHRRWKNQPDEEPEISQLPGL